MRSLIEKVIFTVCVVGMAGCASAAQTYTWQDIKQEVTPTTAPKSDTNAYLRVYTKSERVNDGGYLWVRGPRYTIFSDTGKKIKYVDNENTPDTFTLAPGKYVIVPESSQYKNEITGAVLEPGRITEVHMLGG